MTYWNPVMRMGVDEFSRRLAEAGGAGLITPDLIPDEAAEWFAASDKYGLDRVFLVAPSSYAGTPGQDRGGEPRLRLRRLHHGRHRSAAVRQQRADKDVVADTHAAGAERVCVGLGVSNADQVREIAAYADGVIVGTALVAAIRDGGVDAVAQLTKNLSAGLGRQQRRPRKGKA